MINGTGARRLLTARIAVAAGAYAVVTIELAGAVHALRGATIAAAWAVAAAVLAAVVAVRPGWRKALAAVPGAVRALPGRVRLWWDAAAPLDRFLVAVVGSLMLAELIVALLAPPNNFDSQTYHLPRIEHWVADRDVAFFPTAIHRQISLGPGGEYLLTHLRLLTGTDRLYNLVQWGMGGLAVLMAARICAQLGGGRRAQLITAFAVATTPMVTLQASSTQVDLIVAGWVACLATFVLDGVRTRLTAPMVAWLGLAAGMCAVTKATGTLAAAALLLLWGVAQLRLHGSLRGAARVATGSLAVAAVALLVVGPFLARSYGQFGSVLGSPQLEGSIAMQRHDPAAILINGLRIAHTALDTPLSPVRWAGATAIKGVAGLLGVDPNDRAITFGVAQFPVMSWYPDEDRVALPLQGALALLAAGFLLARPARFTREPVLLRAYVGTVALCVLLYDVTVKWQPWGNRLILFVPVLAAPLTGLWADRVLDRGGAPRLPVRALTATLLVAALSAALAVGYGFPRRLVGTGSVFTTSSLDLRFLRRPSWKDDFVAAGRAVDASGARRIGLVQQNDNWEYPWWVLLRGRTFVALQTKFPELKPPAPASVDAIVCTGNMTVCRRYVPAGWTFVAHGYAGYALPPGAPR